MFAAFAQGVILGALVEGMPLQGGKYVGGAFGWFSPFSMLTGVAVVFGYALLGATWLMLKTEGRMQQIARSLTRPLVLVVVAFMGLVSAWLPFLDSRIMARWFESGNFWWLAPVPLLALVNAFALWRAAMQRGPRRGAVPADPVLLRARLRRAGAGHLAEHRAAGDDASGMRPRRRPRRASCWSA